MGGGDEVEETAMQKELAVIASEKWAISQKNLQPLEDMMIVDTKKGVTNVQRDKVSGTATLASQTQFGKASGDTLKSLSSRGVDPTSGKAKESLSDIDRAGGGSLAASMVESEAGLQSNQMNKELNLLRVGSGEATQAQASMADVASRSAQKATFEAQMAINENQGLRELAGTVGGAAAGYYGGKPTKEQFDAQHASKFGVKG